MKKLLIGALTVILSTFGLHKLAEKLDSNVTSKAVESKREVAANGGFTPRDISKGTFKI